MNKYIFSFAVLVLILGATPAFAADVQVNTRASLGLTADSSVKLDARMKDRGLAEIDRRIDSLNNLTARIKAMTRISSTTKATISADIEAQVQIMNNLRAKIQDDSSGDLTIDKASITSSYRIYALVIPQASILAAADRVLATADIMTAFGTKLDTRITAAHDAGTDTTSAKASLDAYSAAIADATVHANAAINGVSGLIPDNGDQAKLDANKKALVAARADIKAASDDLHKARSLAADILKSLGVKVSASVKGEIKGR